MCGRVVCSSCSPHKGDIARLNGAEPTGKLERVCSACFKLTSGPGQVNQTGGEKRHACLAVHVRWLPGAEHVSVGEQWDSVCLSRTAAQNDSSDEPVGGVSAQEQLTDSSETEDSDDSEVEAAPIPPPRRKKLQQRPKQEEVIPDSQLPTDVTAMSDQVPIGADNGEKSDQTAAPQVVQPPAARRRKQKYQRFVLRSNMSVYAHIGHAVLTL